MSSPAPSSWATSFLADVLDEAAALQMPGWQRFLLTLAVALLAVLGRDALRALVRGALRASATPPPSGDDAPSSPSPASWGANVRPHELDAGDDAPPGG